MLRRSPTWQTSPTSFGSTGDLVARARPVMALFGHGREVRLESVLRSIVLKKSRVPPQENSRKSEPTADFGLRCPLSVFGKATGWIRSRKAIHGS
jgi:hypothetical protein